MRRLTKDHPYIRVNTQLKHFGQWWCMAGLPTPPMTACPAVTAKRPVGTVTLVEYGPPVMRWHPRQWHARVMRGAPVN